jgi:hypothetical protein
VKILIDECVPKPLGRFFPQHTVSTVQEIGWSGIMNGELIKRAESSFDLLITSDKNIKYQQNLSDRKIALLVLSTNDWEILRDAKEKIITAFEIAQAS